MTTPNFHRVFCRVKHQMSFAPRLATMGKHEREATLNSSICMEIHREKLNHFRSPLKLHILLLSIIFSAAYSQLTLLRVSTQLFDVHLKEEQLPTTMKTIGRHGPIVMPRSIYKLNAHEEEKIKSMLQGRKLSQKCFVCITGQVERLELEDKVLHLLDPLRRAGLTPEVALVLTDLGVPRFTNHGFKGGQLYSNYYNASTFLESLGYKVLSTGPFHQSEDPQISLTYIDKMGNTTVNFLPGQRKNRAQNHYRQFESLRECGTLYDEANTNYAFAIRAREDLGFRIELWNGTSSNLTSVLRDLYRMPKTILSTDCRTYDGINDRFAWVSPAAVTDYFTTPLTAIIAKRVPKLTRNPETFLLHSYLNANLTVVLTSRLRGLLKLKISKSNTTKPANDREWKGMFCPEDKHGQRALKYLDLSKVYARRETSKTKPKKSIL